MLESFKKTVQLFFARKRKVKEHRSAVAKNSQKNASMAFFFCINTSGEFTKIRTLVKQTAKRETRLTAFVFYPGYQSLDVVTDKSILFFNLNDFSLFAKMKLTLKKKLQQNSFSILISFYGQPDPICQSVLSEIQAGLKVGPFYPESHSNFDLTIKTDIQARGFEHYFTEVKRYLKVLNIANTSI